VKLSDEGGLPALLRNYLQEQVSVEQAVRIPTKLPGLKLATVLLGIYSAAWISLEGNLWQAVLMGVGVTSVTAGHLAQRYLSGRLLAIYKWLLLTGMGGLFLGLGSGLLTLFFMAVKTGLHAHGPEFSLEEINWVRQQIPLWTAVGLLAGLGLGLLATSLADS
jgi:hypothetical protein